MTQITGLMQRMTQTNFEVILAIFVQVIDQFQGKAAAAELSPLAREAQIRAPPKN